MTACVNSEELTEENLIFLRKFPPLLFSSIWAWTLGETLENIEFKEGISEEKCSSLWHVGRPS